MFKKILIANRGEIACRVAATARRLGVRTVAVYSDADADARHVRACDEAVHIGGAAPRDSYLRWQRILEAAQATGAQAVHPGYGFLSENEAFAQACADAGLVFIGPPAGGDPRDGQQVGGQGADGARPACRWCPATTATTTTPRCWPREADAHRLPGADQGQRRRRRQGHAPRRPRRGLRRRAGLVPARGEGQLRRRPRAGRALRAAAAPHRDPGLRRQPRPLRPPVRARLLGAAPPPEGAGGSARAGHERAERRAEMGAAAVAAAQAVGYVGAGTVEFIAEERDDGDLRFYFMEMNTRLQVEHPVTEAITGLDLVEWQLRVAAGEPLPLRAGPADDPRPRDRGAHLRREPRRATSCPPPARCRWLRWPAHVAFDAPSERACPARAHRRGFGEGDAISPYYDSMIAKLIVWGDDRAQALARLDAALRDTHIVGLHTNVAFLRRVVGSQRLRHRRPRHRADRARARRAVRRAAAGARGGRRRRGRARAGGRGAAAKAPTPGRAATAGGCTAARSRRFDLELPGAARWRRCSSACTTARTRAADRRAALAASAPARWAATATTCTLGDRAPAADGLRAWASASPCSRPTAARCVRRVRPDRACRRRRGRRRPPHRADAGQGGRLPRRSRASRSSAARRWR